MKKLLISMVIVIASLYVGGWYHAQEKCSNQGDYLFDSEVNEMPPIYRQAFLQHSDGCERI